MIGDSLGSLARVFLLAVGTRDEEISDARALGAGLVLLAVLLLLVTLLATSPLRLSSPPFSFVAVHQKTTSYT
ncbi:MAG: hypothetical protein H8K06_19580 [Nitrospira sp.]|uniref:Uncharacterized protein n=1 Tax=Nitrospira defluvii TaxID=330214 RepID=A0ABM8QFK9_9BACT|nr:hypothetical protein [Nitrospira defluvii]MCS6329261.1 hypothetical protein [Nitrospira sp.]CAE6694216.1 hypothetical protein NSPZN2_10375 [Nitrospira defluvii]